MKKSIILFPALLLTAALIMISCSTLDVVGNTSLTSFGEVVRVMSESITSEQTSWILNAPDGSVEFSISRDFSESSTDVSLSFELKPFTDAGLDPEKLPDGYVQGDKIVISADYGDKGTEEATDPVSAYEQIVKSYRKQLSYHSAMDHFGVSIGSGNMFEWAKDMSTNDKDIVFVLNPEVFINAGADPEKIEGWTFAKVEIMDQSGRKIQFDNLLKPFDIE